MAQGPKSQLFSAVGRVETMRVPEPEAWTLEHPTSFWDNLMLNDLLLFSVFSVFRLLPLIWNHFVFRNDCRFCANRVQQDLNEPSLLSLTIKILISTTVCKQSLYWSCWSLSGSSERPEQGQSVLGPWRTRGTWRP